MLLDHEFARLSALLQYDVLDTPPEENFDRLTTMAAHLFNVHIACITLVDENRFYFKSTFGADVTEMGRQPGFCDTAIQMDGVYCIEDTAKEPMLCNHPLVRSAPHVRFYAGSPLRTSDGFAIGTLCIMDPQTRSFTENDQMLLHELSQFVMFQLDRRRLVAEAERRAEVSRNNQKLESLGLLTGGIAHDFNNLLVGIMGNATVASQHIKTDGPAHDAVADIVHAADQARALTEQLLAYAGQRPTSPQAVDLARLIDDMSPLIRSSISSNVRLQIEVSPQLPPAVGDLTQLRQVILNLVTNASEAYGNESGPVNVRLDSIEIEEPGTAGTVIGDLVAGTYVRLEVKDSGCGMNSETLKSLFSPFFSTKFSGRGLGMTIVQRIVRGHGGLIQVDSSPDCGSSICVYLPAGVMDNKTELHEAQPATVTCSGNGTVLVVDDEELVLTMSTTAIESFGFDVVSASSGSQALKILDSHTDINALVLDATMPEMDGATTLATVRKKWPDMPTIITSGHHIDEVSSQFQEFEKLTFLPKPWSIQHLSNALEEAMSK